MIHPWILAFIWILKFWRKWLIELTKHCNIVRYLDRHPIFKCEQNAYALQASGYLLVLYFDPRDTTPVLTLGSQPRHYDARPSGPISLPWVVLGSIWVGCLHVIILIARDLVKIRLRMTNRESSPYYRAIYLFNEGHRVPSTPPWRVTSTPQFIQVWSDASGVDISRL